MDGVELVRQLRQQRHTDALKLIVYAYDWSDIETEARSAGADDCMTQPLFRSRLDMTLRDVVAGEQVKQKESELEIYAEKNFSDKRILLVEDNELNQEIAQEIIGMTGAQIEVAENGRQALELFEQHRNGYYDMIFMDIQMPVMDGYQATRAIRQLKRQDASVIPIVAMSANAFTEDMESSRRAGMNDHIAKPVSLSKLLAIMENYLGVRSGQEKLQVEEPAAQSKIASAKYYEELYFVNGKTEISEETERACIDVLDKNGAVGIFGLLEQKDYPIYFVSGFALTSLGYTYEELIQATDGHFMDLVYEEDRQAILSEFYEKGHKYQYRVIAKSGEIMLATSYVADSYLIDGNRTRILSMRVESGSALRYYETGKNQIWRNYIHDSIVKNALYSYEMDVTTGLIRHEIVGYDGTSYNELIGVEPPCMFDDLVRGSCAEQFRCSLEGITELGMLSSHALLDAFARGESRPEIEFYQPRAQQYQRVTYYMVEDEPSGHVMALAVCHNITKLNRKKQGKPDGTP